MNPKRSKNGGITLKLEELSKKVSGNIVKLVIEGTLNKKEQNFFRLLRAKEGMVDHLPIYQSETAHFANNIARWRVVKIGAAGLMKDDPNYPLSMELYAYRSNGNHVLLGSYKFTFAQLLENAKWNGSFGNVQ